MYSDYERKRYKRQYFLITVIFLLVSFGWIILNWGEVTWRTGGMILIFLLFSIAGYCISYQNVDSAYVEMEHIAETMDNMIGEKGEPPAEEYREGTTGILYTNFYKMVRALKESRNREWKEKIFLRDIISDISHQLKTPLSSLMVFVDLLLEDKVEEKEKQKQILSEAANQLNRMEWMVLSMLKLARIEAGAIQFERTKINLVTFLMQAAEGVQFLIEERGQKLFVQCEPDISLFCDGDWLTEAVINLLKNASDYSREEQSIWIEVEDTKVYTRIYVKDEGMGIPEEELPNIFKRFYRVNREVNPNSVGIGLSLTKSIIEGMGGAIRVKSEEGKYTWFVLTFVK